MSDTVVLCEQQPQESSEAFAAFLVYRDLPRGERTATAAYRATRVNETQGKKVSGQWLGWARSYQWEKRAEAYDRYEFQIAQQARETVIVTTNGEWQRRRDVIRHEEWVASRALYQKAMEMLAFPLATTTTKETVEDGKTIIHTEVHAGKWTFRDAAQMIDVAGKLARLSAEMETSRTGVTFDVIIAAITAIAPDLSEELSRELSQAVLEG